MGNTVSAKFEEYQHKFPLYTKEAIVDLMLDDGVITFDIANKIKSGMSLFLIDEEFKVTPEDDINMTKILGGNFNILNSKPKTNFNKKIEATFQPETQGDCWLLSDINALNQTDWGKQVISDAIEPDADGSGGVTIKFKGSPLKQKNIHITAEQIEEARESGNYASGDDDMIAFELATEYTFREMVRSGLAKRIDSDESLQSQGAKYCSYIYGGVSTAKYKQYPISELLGVSNYEVDFNNGINKIKNSASVRDKIFKWFSENKDDVSATCGFAFIMGGIGDKNSKDYIHGGHAYAIKKVIYGKEVVIIDPHYADYDIRVPWNTFLENVDGLNFSFKNSNLKQQLKNMLPNDFDYQVKKNREEFSREFKNEVKKFELAQEKQDSIDNARRDSLRTEYQKKEALEEQKHQQDVRKRKDKIFHLLKEFKRTNNVEYMEKVSALINEDTVIDVLNAYPDIIETCDKLAYGWGKGQKKKALIYPIIFALRENALDKHVKQDKVEDFFEKCCNELNAIFYTDEKVIIEEVNKMKQLIKEKR